MTFASRLSRLLLVSPWLLPVFLVIPLLAILSISLKLTIFPFSVTIPLLVNNICFALIAGCRFIRYLVKLSGPTRYFSTGQRLGRSEIIRLPLTEVRSIFAKKGYHFDTNGCYGEKRDIGYLGTTAFYGGLFLLLTVGNWDNLQQFSAVLLDGMGPATNLNKAESYRSITRGPLASMPVSLPRMRITNQIFPDKTYPMGATEIALLSDDGHIEKVLLKPRDPVSYGAYDIYMAKLVFEPQLVIKRSDNNQPLFDSIVTLNPLVQKRGAYSFYGLFQGYNLGGGVYYQPEKSSLLVVLSRNDKKVVADLEFQVDQEVKQGDFIISCARMGQWSEIHVVHRRHKELLFFGGITALMGLLLRIAFRPQRVWIEETPEWCRVYGTGRTVELLKSDK